MPNVQTVDEYISHIITDFGSALALCASSMVEVVGGPVIQRLPIQNGILVSFKIEHFPPFEAGTVVRALRNNGFILGPIPRHWTDGKISYEPKNINGFTKMSKFYQADDNIIVCGTMEKIIYKKICDCLAVHAIANPSATSQMQNIIRNLKRGQR